MLCNIQNSINYKQQLKAYIFDKNYSVIKNIYMKYN